MLKKISASEGSARAKLWLSNGTAKAWPELNISAEIVSMYSVSIDNGQKMVSKCSEKAEQ